MPVPSGPELGGNLEVIDSSQGHWAGLATQITQADDNGFEASCSAADGTKIDLHVKFEKSGNALACSLKWEANAELPEAFMMFVFRLPIENFQDGLISSGEGGGISEISMAKILAGEPTRTSMDGITSFSMGPIDGKTVVFTSESLDTPLSVEVIKTATDFHVRFLITPRKAPLPATGTVGWTVAAE